MGDISRYVNGENVLGGVAYNNYYYFAIIFSIGNLISSQQNCIQFLSSLKYGTQ